MTRKISSFVAGIVFLVLSPFALAQTKLPVAIEDFDKMSLKQKVGQVFIWTYPGTSFSTVAQTWLEQYQPGALIVFSRNIQSPAQIARFNSDLQKFAAKKMKAPFFLMIDQEGGTVTRLRTSTPLPSALALGKMDDTEFTQKFGHAVADVIKSIGFNVNLAPVLDISNPDKDSFIGNRAFGNDPDVVAERAGAYSLGLSEGGVMPTAKHFPGHGGVVQDSHQTTPKKLATYEELADKDLVPFEEYAQSEYPRAVMMAHLALPNIDPSGVPSTYSTLLIRDHLRTKLKYDGLVITDDLEMSGASVEYSVGERAIRAFLAGNDMLMLAGSPAHQKAAFNAVFDAVKSGRISEARLKESVSRILAYKRQLKIDGFTYNEKKSKENVLALEVLSKQVLHKNLKLALEEKTTPWPEVTDETRTLVLGSDKRFFQSFQMNFRGKAGFFQLTPQSLARASKAVTKDSLDLIIFYASGAQTARWLSHLTPELRTKTIVVNVNNPAEIENQASYLAVLNMNSAFPESGAPLAEFLCKPELRTPASKKPEAAIPPTEE